MGTVSQDTGGPSDVPRIVATNAQRWCVEIDGYPRRLSPPGQNPAYRLSLSAFHFVDGTISTSPWTIFKRVEREALLPLFLDIAPDTDPQLVRC